MVYRRGIRKGRRYRIPRPRRFQRGESMVHEHTLAFGVVADVFGNDGSTTAKLFTDFRNTADCAGMYRSFRILAYGMDFGATTLDPTTKTIRTVNVALRIT